MGLILPAGPSFAHWTDNLSDMSGAAAFGTPHQAGASGVFSTPGTVLSALTHDCELLCLGWGGFGVSGADQSTLLDVLVDPSGGTSWSVLIEHVLVGMDTTAISGISISTGGTPYRPTWLYFPLWLPAGASIGVRARSVAASPAVNGSTAPRIFMMAAGGNRNPGSWWCGQKVETVGSINTSTCRGEDHTPDLNPSFSSWTDFGSPLSAQGGALAFCSQGAGTASQNGTPVAWEVGIGGQKIGPTFLKGYSSSETGVMFNSMPIFCQLPAGAQMQIRAKAALNVFQTYDCAIYVVQ